MSKLILNDNLKAYHAELAEHIKLLQRNTAYVLDDIVNYDGKALKCTTAGTTATTKPDVSALDVGNTYIDGTCVWTRVDPDKRGIDYWEASTTYALNDQVVNDNKIYKCITAHTSTSTFDATKWTEISAGGGGSIDEWTSGTSYASGDLVTKDNILYKANTTTSTTWVGSEWNVIGTPFTTISTYTQKIVTGVVAPYEILLQVGYSNYCKPPIDVLKKTGGSNDGVWSQSVHGTDYDVAYPNITTMLVNLKTNGDYIINYPIASGALPLDYVVRFRATNVGVKDLVSSNLISTTGSVQPIVDTDFYNGVALKCANNSYVKIDLSSPFEVNGLEEFTISCFVKCSSVNTWEPLFGKGRVNYGPSIWISYNGAFTPWFRAVNDTSVTISPSISCSMNVVHHIALVKAGDTMSLYVDGILSNSTTYTSTIDFGSQIFIGTIGSFSSTAEVNDLCIIRNKALWTTNFVPPIEYLPDRW